MSAATAATALVVNPASASDSVRRTSAADVTAFKAKNFINLDSTSLTRPSLWNEVKMTAPLPVANRTASGASIVTPAVVFNWPFNNTDTSSPRKPAVRQTAPDLQLRRYLGPEQVSKLRVRSPRPVHFAAPPAPPRRRPRLPGKPGPGRRNAGLTRKAFRRR